MRAFFENYSRLFLTMTRLLFVIAIVVAAVYFLMGGNQQLALFIEQSPYPYWVWLLLCCFIYAMVLIIPFAPGMELGMLIMVMFSTTGIIAAWLTTIVALAIAFSIGRAGQHFLWVQRFLFYAHGQQALPKSIRWARTTLSKFPHLTIAVLLNLPGNTFIGGGGGIAIVSGAMGTVKLKGFILTVAIASSFIPLALITGLATLD